MLGDRCVNRYSPDGRTHYSVMDDIAAFNFSTNEAPKQLNYYMAMTATTSDDYDCLVLHQANLMAMKRIAKKTAFPEAKIWISMDRFGNTFSSSVPISLVDKYGKNSENETIRPL